MNEGGLLGAVAGWAESELRELERRAGRRRGDYQKAQYLKGVSYTLLHEKEAMQQKKGVALMEKMIELFPNEYLCTMMGHSCLGKYYRSIGEYDAALAHFEQMRRHNNVSTCKYGMPEMQIALTIIMSEQTDQYDYARTMLGVVNPRTMFVKEHVELYRMIESALNGSGSIRKVAEYYHNVNGMETI